MIKNGLKLQSQALLLEDIAILSEKWRDLYFSILLECTSPPTTPLIAREVSQMAGRISTI
jgi:hypothetical protein